MTKKIFSLLFLLSIMFTYNQSHASVCITESGMYENKDIQFHVNFTWGNSTPRPGQKISTFQDVQFSIISKNGYVIYNKTYFIYEGRSYIFNSSKIKDSFYKEGTRTFDNREIKDNSIITLVYELREKGSAKYIKTRTVTKKFRIERPKKLSGWNGKITLHEMSK